MDSLPYATTPLALASLAIIAGVGLLKLIVVGRNTALNRLVTHYGFIVVIMFGILGNAAYLYGVYHNSELIIMGNVVDKDGHYLPNVAIDTGGHARGMTSDTGDFVLAIPVSRKSDSYDVTAALAGYEKAEKIVKNGSQIFVRFEMAPKIPKASDILKFSGGELVVGHYMGLPEIYVTIGAENPGAALLTVSDFLITLRSPSGKVRQLIQVNSAPAMNGAIGPPLPQVQVKVGEKFSWTSGFVQYDNQVQQLATTAVQALQSSQDFRLHGPQVNRQLLSANLTDSIQKMVLKNWFWEPGVTKMELTFNVSGSRYQLSRKITLSEDQVDAMQRSNDYYNAGYGVIFGAELVPVGSAKPGQKVTVEDI